MRLTTKCASFQMTFLS